jgi:UDP-N-acetylmuramate--alanine ligase
MSLRGHHNVLNVTAAIAMAMKCGVEPRAAINAVATFGGVGRRFEIIGSADGVTFVDDYAHLPREISAVMAAAKTSDDSWGRVVAVFQPNRYNRMAVMSDEYSMAFVDADVVVITDIYASGTQKIEGVTGQLVVDAITRAQANSQVHWHEERSSLAEFVNQLLRPGDVCISMGCGDIESLPRELIDVRSGVMRP